MTRLTRLILFANAAALGVLCALHAAGVQAVNISCVGETDGHVLTCENDEKAYWQASAGGGASQLSDLSDVGVTTATNRNALMADGDSWESRALVEADISDLGSYLTAETNDLEGSASKAFGAFDTMDTGAFVRVSTEYHEGAAADPRIYDRALSDAEIAAIAAGN